MDLRTVVNNCAACGNDPRKCQWFTIDGIEMRLCTDAVACARRYRQGASPASYAAGLRGELLAVTP